MHPCGWHNQETAKEAGEAQLSSKCSNRVPESSELSPHHRPSAQSLQGHFNDHAPDSLPVAVLTTFPRYPGFACFYFHDHPEIQMLQSAFKPSYHLWFLSATFLPHHHCLRVLPSSSLSHWDCFNPLWQSLAYWLCSLLHPPLHHEWMNAWTNKRMNEWVNAWGLSSLAWTLRPVIPLATSAFQALLPVQATALHSSLPSRGHSSPWWPCRNSTLLSSPGTSGTTSFSH